MDMKCHIDLVFSEALQARNDDPNGALRIQRWNLSLDWPRALYAVGCVDPIYTGKPLYVLEVGGKRRVKPYDNFEIKIQGEDLLEVCTRSVAMLDAAGEALPC